VAGNYVQPAAQSGERFYLLTHDYLVPSLREWLTRKQRETRRGRAKLRLAERAALWQAKPENRFLPSAWEWIEFSLLTKKTDWSDLERLMMRKADWFYWWWELASALLLMFLVVGGLLVFAVAVESNQSTHADGLVDAVFTADFARLPEIVPSMKNYRSWVDPALKRELEQAAEGSERQLRASLALLPVDQDQVDRIYTHPLRKMISPLASIVRDDQRLESDRAQATDILAQYGVDDPLSIADLLMDAGPRTYAVLFPIVEHHARATLPVFQAEIAKTAVHRWMVETGDSTQVSLAKRSTTKRRSTDPRCSSPSTLPPI